MASPDAMPNARGSGRRPRGAQGARTRGSWKDERKKGKHVGLAAYDLRSGFCGG